MLTLVCAWSAVAGEQLRLNVEFGPGQSATNVGMVAGAIDRHLDVVRVDGQYQVRVVSPEPAQVQRAYEVTLTRVGTNGENVLVGKARAMPAPGEPAGFEFGIDGAESIVVTVQAEQTP